MLKLDMYCNFKKQYQIRVIVRAGGMPPVNFSQLMAATHQYWAIDAERPSIFTHLKDFNISLFAECPPVRLKPIARALQIISRNHFIKCLYLLKSFNHKSQGQ